MTKIKEERFPEFELLDFIETTSCMECFSCKMRDCTTHDFGDAMNFFYQEGWRLFKDQPYCKSCLTKLNP
jgi:hypothetical protein